MKKILILSNGCVPNELEAKRLKEIFKLEGWDIRISKAL